MRLPTMGSKIAYAEPMDLQGFSSPHYTQAHVQWRKHVRAFVDKEISPFVEKWDEQGDVPVAELRAKMYSAGIYSALYPREWGGTPPPGSEGDWSGSWAGTKVDPFFDLIITDELTRCGTAGVVAALCCSGIALPPLIMYASDDIKNRLLRDLVTGAKAAALCLTEPTGGSDLAAIQTTAVLSDDKTYYTLNGSKKWITGGMKADVYTVICKTGKGHSLLCVEKGSPGLTVRRIKTQGWLASNTAFVTFEDVRVPVANLVGQEGGGFLYAMVNLNHERFAMATQAVRLARICLQDAIEWAKQRITFKKRLVDHQVIRHKIAEMVRRIEGTWSMLENYCYQVKCGQPDSKLYGYMALLKVQATKTLEFCAREASQIFGGASFTRTGKGARVERIYREVRVMAIGGGSEEVLMNLAVSHARL